MDDKLHDIRPIADRKMFVEMIYEGHCWSRKLSASLDHNTDR